LQLQTGNYNKQASWCLFTLASLYQTGQPHNINTCQNDMIKNDMINKYISVVFSMEHGYSAFPLLFQASGT
jgi:hypothetical protein